MDGQMLNLTGWYLFKSELVSWKYLTFVL